MGVCEVALGKGCKGQCEGQVGEFSLRLCSSDEEGMCVVIELLW